MIIGHCSVSADELEDALQKQESINLLLLDSKGLPQGYIDTKSKEANNYSQLTLYPQNSNQVLGSELGKLKPTHNVVMSTICSPGGFMGKVDLDSSRLVVAFFSPDKGRPVCRLLAQTEPKKYVKNIIFSSRNSLFLLLIHS